uniref:Uncharacterized protein n=1 Tax=Siphoviridae sp. ctLmu1 TaxID=2826253 RepID=A0A8S5NG61_9CAUD|nr:MAG TPA: hypothetical protein [Siphoviridae sp. ctLmu1]
MFRFSLSVVFFRLLFPFAIFPFFLVFTLFFRVDIK